jgi:tyrosine aminotransferase/nicotianamine aminotransferase
MATHQRNGHSATAENGHSNGKTNGHNKEQSNNHSNGKSNGHVEVATHQSNGKSNGHSNGHVLEEVDWKFARAKDGVLATTGAKKSIRAIRFKISASVEENGPRPVLPLAHGDPSVFPAFRTAVEAEDAVAATLRTGELNCYPPGVGLPAARR